MQVEKKCHLKTVKMCQKPIFTYTDFRLKLFTLPVKTPIKQAIYRVLPDHMSVRKCIVKSTLHRNVQESFLIQKSKPVFMLKPIYRILERHHWCASLLFKTYCIERKTFVLSLMFLLLLPPHSNTLFSHSQLKMMYHFKVKRKLKA